jgi:murein DD-endopeptidase MepM/ murein hydrolase activator NlpD
MKVLIAAAMALLVILTGLTISAGVFVVTTSQAADCGLPPVPTASGTGATGGTRGPGSAVGSGETGGCGTEIVAGAAVTFGTLNLLGAGHTDTKPGGGKDRHGFAGWAERLPGAMSALEGAGVSIAALQEVHPPQAAAIAREYTQRWAMFPADGPTQNKIVWDPEKWTATDQRLIQIPYFGGALTAIPLVQLTSTTSGLHQWVLGLHNPADTHGSAARYRTAALRIELDTARAIAATGDPIVVLGDFNDAHDTGTRAQSSHCVLTPTLTNAFGAGGGAGDTTPCRPPAADAAVDHIYGANLTWSDAHVDHTTETTKTTDHPLVTATAASTGILGCDPRPPGVRPASADSTCGPVVYPVPVAYIGNDAHNWHDNGSHWGSWHTGTDFAAPCGTPVLAAHAGTIEIDTTQPWAGPTLVKVVTGPSSLATWYAHMQQLTVSRGQRVQAGQQIGYIGEEGNAFGCHLHFEVHLRNGTIYGPDNVDPSLWLLERATTTSGRVE